MSRSKEQWLEHTGGFRLGESPAAFQERVVEIEKLEREFRAAGLTMGEREKILRQLCALKGIDFDSDDDE